MRPTCQQCGRTISDESPGGSLCLVCLWDFAGPPSAVDELPAGSSEETATVAIAAGPESPPESDGGWAASINSSSLPAALHRYRHERDLGKGGFGRVVLAEDSVLKRRVAIKILSHAGADPAAAAAFLNEARLLARMDHPGIMPVYDAVETDDGRFCIVSRFVDGPSLAIFLRERALSRHETAAIVSSVCDALEHAHRQGVVHLDVKPANIVLAAGRNPVLLDFGIARLWQNFSGGGRVSGTPAYMSPEQARGEDHLVDGRSDIFSTGAILYEMLTSQRAWDASSPADLVRRVSGGDLIPPRRVDATIPRELERICLKALQLRPRDRYGTAADFAQDLREWMSAESATVVTPASARPVGPVPAGATPRPDTVPVLPRGLRGYDESDADFFLNLVPGPRDRHGLPESVRTWKQRIEAIDDTAERICVLYGPSGSGKSSFLRAALIPRLERHVHVIRVDAADRNMHDRMLHAIRARFPNAPAAADAPSLLQALRQGTAIPPGQKLAVVIDQAEQWLRAPGEQRTDLPAILRQCDGSRVQALMVVRDDFWRGLTLLLDEAGTAINPDNSALIDLFDLRHAARVLELSGRALGLLPADPAVALEPDSSAFIHEAVAGLAEHGLVSPARLALFTQMFRTRPWTPAALRQIGGIQRLGAAFLEDAFLGAGATAQHRLHERAARAVLVAMLPETGEVRDAPVPELRLREVSGYGSRPRLFAELLQVLDKDLRLLMPVEGDEPEPVGGGTWQLTHDQLIPALRDWLHARDAASLRGRAGIRLKERAAEFRLRASSRTAPGILEWLRFRFLTNRQRWTRDESTFMRRGQRGAVLSGIGLAGLVTASWLTLAAIRGTDRARTAVEAIVSASAGEIVRLAKESAPWRDRVVPELRRFSAGEGQEATSAAIALLALGKGAPETVGEWMLSAPPAGFTAARDAFQMSGAKLPESLWTGALMDHDAPPARRLRALAALTSLAPSRVPAGAGTDPVGWLMLAGSEAPLWAPLLSPIAASLNPGLQALIAGTDQKAKVREASGTLVALHTGDADALAGLVGFIPADHLGLLREALHATGPTGIVALREFLEKTPAVPPKPTAATPEERIVYQSRAHAATLLAALGTAPESGGFTLDRSPDRTERTLFTLAASPAGVPAITIANRLRSESQPGIRFALLITLASYRPGDLPGNDLTRFLDWLRSAWLTDPDGGCHSAMRWLADQWVLPDVAKEMDQSAKPTKEPKPGFSWWVTPSGVDMRIITLLSGRRTAMAAKEYAEGRKSADHQAPPEGSVSWISAVKRCVELSAGEGILDDAQTYVVSASGVSLRSDGLETGAYRLPTEEEWVSASNYGSAALTESGAFPEFLLLSAWLIENSRETARPGGLLRPGDAGLFDVYGNMAEWTHEPVDDGKAVTAMLAGRRAIDRIDAALTRPFWPYSIKSGAGFLQCTGFRLARTLSRS